MTFKGSLKLTYFETTHDHCWINFTREHDIIVKVLGVDFTNPQSQSFNAKILIVGKDLWKFISKLKKNRYVEEVTPLEISKRYAAYDLKIRYHSTASEIVKSARGVIIDFRVEDGKEKCKVLIPSSVDLKSILQKKSTLLKYCESDLSSYIDEMIELSLSEKEVDVLKTAYMLGYFDYPKKMGVRDVARVSKINTATLLYYLRRANRKIISSYLNRIENRCYETYEFLE